MFLDSLLESTIRLLISLFLIAPGQGIGCMFIAKAKNLNMRTWFFVGYFLGPIGLLIVALTPKQEESFYYSGTNRPAIDYKNETKSYKLEKEIKHLKKLRDDGMISDDEYTKEKKRIEKYLDKLKEEEKKN